MKKWNLWILLFSILSTLFIPISLKADIGGTVELSEKNFPDSAFRKWLAENLDNDENGRLVSSEVPSYLEIESSDISSLEGLLLLAEYTTSVKLTGMTLDALDLSGITGLSFLTARNCNISRVNVSGCTALRDLDIDGCNVQALDISGCIELRDLALNKNHIKSLDTGDCTALTSLRAADNQLKKLDIKKCTALTKLEVSGNPLESLDVSSCQELTDLMANKTFLKTINVKQCTKLEDLRLNETPITTLDVSGLDKLKKLTVCDAKELESIDAGNCKCLKSLAASYGYRLRSLNIKGCEALEYLYVESNQLSSLDAGSLKSLVRINAEDNELRTLNLSGCSALAFLMVHGNSLTELDVRGIPRFASLLSYGSPELHNGYILNYHKNGKSGDDVWELAVDKTVTLIVEGGTIPGETKEKEKNTITAKDIIRSFSLKKQTFSIGAQALGGAELTYRSSNSKHISVDKNSGKVTVNKAYVGKTTITITAKATDTYKTAAKKITVRINPAAPKTLSLNNSKKGKLTVKWKKSASAKATGYEIEYSTSKRFTKKTTRSATIKGQKSVKTTLSNLKKGKKYYVRVRTYLKDGAEVYRSPWITRSIKITK